MTRTFLLPLALVLLQVGPILAQDNYLDVGEPEFEPCSTVAGGSLFKPLNKIKSVVANDGKRLPPDCSMTHFTSKTSGSDSRFYQDTEYHWQPTDFFHMPAYFDDVPLERYGQTKAPRLQPIVSGAKFFLQLPVIPYKIGVDRPHDCISTLGHRPPGDCVPCIRQRLPKELDAAFIQGAATTGLVFLLP